MRTEPWITALKPNDHVNVARACYSPPRSVGRVVKVSPSGWITVEIEEERNQRVFLPSGYMRGSSSSFYSKPRILPYNHEEAEIEHQGGGEIDE